MGNTHYSPVDQINAGNFNKLQVAWRLKTDNFGPPLKPISKSTPLMVKGVLYTTASTRRVVVAANARAPLLWMQAKDEGTRVATNAPGSFPPRLKPLDR